MLESLAAARRHRCYADGVDATVHEGLLQYINPINWFRGKEYQEAAAELRQMGIEAEQEAENTIGHPEFVQAAVQLVLDRVEAVSLIVDDSSAAFTHSGAAGNWRPLQDGYRQNAIWTYNEASRTVNAGRWTPELPSAGAYQVLAYLPAGGAELSVPVSSRARYRVVHAGQATEAVVSQSIFLGEWADLGVHYFNAQGSEYVELVDQTGEDAGSRALLFDAVRWIPAEAGDVQVLNAAPSAGLVYDVILPGETAELRYAVVNTGYVPWMDSSYVLEPAPDNPEGAQTVMPLVEVVAPGESVSWEVRLPAPGLAGVFPVRYQMSAAGEPFGAVITGYVFVLPEQLEAMEERIRQQIDDWREQGEEALQELLERLWQEIQRELERQAQRALQDWLRDCQGQAAGLVVTVATLAVRRRRRCCRGGECAS